jgi:hypothetical protein
MIPNSMLTAPVVRAIAPTDGVKGRSGAPLTLRSSLGCAHP